MSLTTPLLPALEADGARTVERDGWTLAADFGDAAAEWRAATAGPALSDRSARGLLRVHGRDAEKLLQGLVTNDIEALAPGEAAYAFVLTPKGRPILDLRVLREGDEAYLLDCDAGAHDALAATVRRYRLASKAAIDDVRGTLAVIAWLGGAMPDGAATIAGPLGPESIGAPEALAESWRAARGAGAAAVGADAFELLRIDAGVPRLGAEIDESVLPAETGVIERAVSFSKGCYVGQEPVARLHYRGHANRSLRRLTFDGDPPALPADLVVDGKKVGRVTSAAALPSGRAVGLGYLRREVADGARVQVDGAGGNPLAATVEPARP